MARYRIGNDMTILWAINDRDGKAFPLTDKEVHLYYTCERGRFEADIQIKDANIIVWEFLGKNQRTLGGYTLSVEVLHSNGKRVIRRDISNAFVLVGKSCEENDDLGDANINEGGEITLATELDIYRISPVIPEIGDNGNWWVDGSDTGKPSIGEANEVDDELSLSSMNPVQNKVVSSAIHQNDMEITFLKNTIKLLSEEIKWTDVP